MKDRPTELEDENARLRELIAQDVEYIALEEWVKDQLCPVLQLDPGTNSADKLAKLAAAKITEMEALVYVPNEWKRRECGFSVVMNAIAPTGIFADTREVVEPCPNDGMQMFRVTWKEDAYKLGERLESLWKESRDKDERIADLDCGLDWAINVIIDDCAGTNDKAAWRSKLTSARQDLLTRISNLETELKTTDSILDSYTKLRAAIPPCPTHGQQCIPWAEAWIELAIKGSNS